MEFLEKLGGIIVAVGIGVLYLILSTHKRSRDVLNIFVILFCIADMIKGNVREGIIILLVWGYLYENVFGDSTDDKESQKSNSYRPKSRQKTAQVKVSYNKKPGYFDSAFFGRGDKRNQYQKRRKSRTSSNAWKLIPFFWPFLAMSVMWSGFVGNGKPSKPLDANDYEEFKKKNGR